MEASRVIRVVDFKNFIENWEEESIVTKNAVHERKLNDKYQHIYFFDADVDELRRIFHVEWQRGRNASHVAITQLVANAIDVNDIPYVINNELHKMKKNAPAPHNCERTLIGLEE